MHHTNDHTPEPGATRREALATMAAAGLALGLGVGGLTRSALGLARAVEPGAMLFGWSSLGDRAWLASGYGGNAVVINGGDGLVLIDSKLTYAGGSLRREAEQQAGGRIVAAINTHHHADHTGGNWALDGLPRYAHRNATPRVLGQMNRYISNLKEAALQLEGDDPAKVRARTDALNLYKDVTKLKAPQFAPTESIDGDRRLQLGGVKLELVSCGPAHTDNDIAVFVPDRKLMHTGDLVFNRLHPFIDRESGATVRGWITALDRLHGMCDGDTAVVPGHGDRGGRDILMAQKQYFEHMRDEVMRMARAGRTRDQIAATTPDRYRGYGNDRFLRIAWQALYDEFVVGGESVPITPSTR